MSETRGAVSGEIDIVVPVFNACDELIRCVESVLRHSRAPFRLVLIDDASTEPRVADYLAELQAGADPRVQVLRNPRNLGFVGTCNRAFHETTGDLVLLNSDTIVTPGWLDAIRRCAASDPRIATVTPFSNNAEICSFPRFCADNDWTDERAAALTAAAIASAAIPAYPEIPTGVGFCMFVRRQVLEQLGGFDEAFGRGYGEENDLCMRAAKRGYRNVLLDDGYVVHTGGRSFTDSRQDLQRRNLRLLLDRHPDYERVVAKFIAEDPVAGLRAWASSHRALLARPEARGVLHVIHGDGGGTERHVWDLIEGSREEYRHYALKAERDTWLLEDRADAEPRGYAFDLASSPRPVALLGGICASLGVTLIHAHNVSGCREALLASVPAIGVPYGYTFHDLGLACPTITLLDPDGEYCGSETDIEACTRCLGQQPAFAAVDIEAWRQCHRGFVEQAEFLIAPTRWTAAQAQRYFGVEQVTVVPHGLHGQEREAIVARTSLPPVFEVPDDGRVSIAVIGAVGPDKGARKLESLVQRTRERGLPLRWILIGYMDRRHGPHRDDDGVFTVHGRYEPSRLPALFDHYRVRLVVFPSAGPETFSYTLSETWAAGLPALVPEFGALGERMQAHRGGWLLDGPGDPDRMLDRILAIVSPAGQAEYAATVARVARIPRTSLAEMAAATAAIYRRTLPSVSAFPALSNARMVGAAARSLGKATPTWRSELAAGGG